MTLRTDVCGVSGCQTLTLFCLSYPQTNDGVLFSVTISDIGCPDVESLECNVHRHIVRNQTHAQDQRSHLGYHMRTTKMQNSIQRSFCTTSHFGQHLCCCFLDTIHTQRNRLFPSRRLFDIGGKQSKHGKSGSVFIHFYFVYTISTE